MLRGYGVASDNPGTEILSLHPTYDDINDVFAWSAKFFNGEPGSTTRVSVWTLCVDAVAEDTPFIIQD